MSNTLRDIVHIGDLKPQRRNANRHTPRGMKALEESVQRDGWIGAVTVAADGETFDGSARLEVGAATGFEEAIVVESDGSKPVVVVRKDIPTADDPRAVRLGVAANRVAQLNLDWEPEVLAALQEEDASLVEGLWRDEEIAELLARMEDVPGEVGVPSNEQARRTLAERFLVPPFSVFDARQGYWQARKRSWIALGIQSELGRGDNVTYGDGPEITECGLNHDSDLARNKSNGLLGNSEQARSHYRGRSVAAPLGGGLSDSVSGERASAYKAQSRQAALQKTGDSRVPETASLRGGLTWPTTIHPYDETGRKRNAGAKDFGTEGNASAQSGTSIFDPVLCEVVYRWFCPPGGFVLDPFAGGSVRGIVASVLSLHYAGVDLREEQVAANKAQAEAIVPDNPPTWVVGDSRNIKEIAAGEYDLFFTCPPYADLEVYSDDPRDLSTMDYEEFRAAYRQIIADSVALLKPDRFACIVVGDVRDPKGIYRNFVGDTIAAFQDAGAQYYNEGILVTVAGSLPVRAARVFEASRKLGKTHQNVLVFIKGDARKATEACGHVDVSVPEVLEEC